MKFEFLTSLSALFKELQVRFIKTPGLFMARVVG